MSKISQGKFEILTTKADAIDKLMQMQGICREEMSGDSIIEFTCFKSGKIIISDPPSRHPENDNSTDLFAKVIEEGGKTYVSYYTNFSKTNNVFKIIWLSIDIIIMILAIIFALMSAYKRIYLIVFVLALVFFVYQLFTGTKEKENSPKDSEILINELKKRVEAVNMWDK